MPVRTADAEWKGNLREGEGIMKLGSGAFEGSYSFTSRFENGRGTNPEELIAAAHAGCFSMALAAGLAEKGFNPRSIKTNARVSIDRVGEGFNITKSELIVRADVPEIDEATFQEHVRMAKENCPVSKVLKGAEITANAELMHGAMV